MYFKLLLILLAFLSASTIAQVPPRSAHPAFKGIELYSWQNPSSGNWQFSLLAGTNRLKALKEIREPKEIIDTSDLLKQRLVHLAVGEQVMWGNAEFRELSFPPAKVVNDIVKFAQANGVAVTTSRWPSSGINKLVVRVLLILSPQPQSTTSIRNLSPQPQSAKGSCMPSRKGTSNAFSVNDTNE